ncbi:hypothetical protein PFAG_05049 [Plasmodium falciparum Santa Lucia]|uniref:Uncharacterized protein n=5 Tax=Plasmodium falciparum TaxID=5833 RepID=A0A024WGT4_PLAFA|nr:hypothetical protein PFFVO_04591 [Plasmodium falciparum Vietnam Oak-Knoll (FVO)]ETW40467.1 hypothetical protein PFNF135_05157 [Plasmodium falciparum NF135/5.C10]ETW45771.1 hypothetical protein PFMALIP_06163 [Plasmodium falciparum MaliPS096_E11]EUT80408.1 hypothetical protein PFAG_05049 [Plasmodium falciparum Santa Lucia]EWC74267.1 hypothetical protein C923_05072 [Plasmodium falciparum UGT5.1]
MSDICFISFLKKKEDNVMNICENIYGNVSLGKKYFFILNLKT